jgi:REP element-mobilizing transposase RayT
VSGDRYTITDQNAIHFLTFTVVEWIDVFTRPEYKYIIADSLNYCVKEKGLECYAWVLMSNHMHTVVRTKPPFRLSDVIRDFKKFTSKKIVSTMQEIPESRREWLLNKFAYWAHSTGRAQEYKLWQDSNHAICLDGGKRLSERINYTHQNPVKQLIVSRAEDYLFSSACDYCGIKGLVDVVVNG